MVASVPILVTKLFIPPPPPKVVSRARLIEQLNGGLSAGCKLTLVSAPAGFGKTTLVSEWIAALSSSPLPMREGLGVGAAWLSLDEGDSEPVRFLTYIISALRTIAPNIGEEVLGVLQSPQPPIEPLLTALLNEISTLPDKVIFVLSTNT